MNRVSSLGGIARRSSGLDGQKAVCTDPAIVWPSVAARRLPVPGAQRPAGAMASRPARSSGRRAAVAREAPDLLLLNEMPFGPSISSGTNFDATTWQRSLDHHAVGLARLDQLGAKAVAGWRPRRLDARRVNEPTNFRWRGERSEDDGRTWT